MQPAYSHRHPADPRRMTGPPTAPPTSVPKCEGIPPVGDWQRRSVDDEVLHDQATRGEDTHADVELKAPPRRDVADPQRATRVAQRREQDVAVGGDGRGADHHRLQVGGDRRLPDGGAGDLEQPFGEESDAGGAAALGVQCGAAGAEGLYPIATAALATNGRAWPQAARAIVRVAQ